MANDVSCFSDPFNWDLNGNGKIGEIEDSISLNPSLSLSRIPIRSVNNAKVFVTKQLQYEMNPPTDKWSKKLLMCGNKISYCGIVDNDTISDSHWFCEKIYNDHIANYWDGEKIKFYDTGTDFQGNASYQLNESNFQEQLSTGYSFVHISTHGNQTCYELEEGTYSVDSALTLNNKQPTIIVTDACDTNAFDNRPGYFNDPCLSEAFIRNPNSGVIAYLGGSREGISQPIFGGPSFDFVSSFYEQLFRSSNYVGFGDMVDSMRRNMINTCNIDTYRWVMFGMNPIGDPDLPIFVNQPKKFSNISYNYSNNTLTIYPNLSNNDVCNICMKGVKDEFYSIRNRTGHYEVFNNIPNDVWICVSAYGYVPYQMRFCNGCMYILNEMLRDNQSFIANEIHIGRDVDITQGNGSVIVDGNGVQMKAKSKVFIKNSFVVNKGAELIISTGD